MMSREKESNARKDKMTMGCMWKTLWKGEKTTGEQGSSFVLCNNGGFPCIVVIFSLKERPFPYLASLQTFSSFLYFSPLVLTLIVQQHVPFIVRGMLLGTRWMSHYDSLIWTLLQLLYYIVAEGERKDTLRSVYRHERWPYHYVGRKPWIRKGTSRGVRAMHVSPIVVQHMHSQWDGRISYLWPKGVTISLLWVLSVHVRCKSHFLQGDHAIGMDQSPLRAFTMGMAYVICRENLA